MVEVIQVSYQKQVGKGLGGKTVSEFDFVPQGLTVYADKQLEFALWDEDNIITGDLMKMDDTVRFQPE